MTGCALQETFELGVILLRKKLFTQAVKNLEKARKSWDGEPDELAQVPTLSKAQHLNLLRAHISTSARPAA